MLEDGIYKVTKPTGEVYYKEVVGGYDHWDGMGIQNPKEALSYGWTYEKCVVMTEAELESVTEVSYKLGLSDAYN